MPDDELTDTQKAILSTAENYPGISQSEISDKVGCTPGYVSNVLRDYGKAHKLSVIQKIQRMGNYKFEKFISLLWEQKGWETHYEDLPNSKDQGVDVVAIKTGFINKKSKIIQAKRYSNRTKVSSGQIQKYGSLFRHSNMLPDGIDRVDEVAVVTSNVFTKDAIDVADDLGVDTVDGNDLYEIIEDTNSYDLVDKFTPGDTEFGNEESSSGLFSKLF